MWKDSLDKAVEEDVGHEVWCDARTKAKKERLGLVDGEKISPKNQMLIAHTLEILWADSKRSAVLDRLSEAILNYAENAN